MANTNVFETTYARVAALPRYIRVIKQPSSLVRARYFKVVLDLSLFQYNKTYSIISRGAMGEAHSRI
jgi:hypothetical protein